MYKTPQVKNSLYFKTGHQRRHSYIYQDIFNIKNLLQMYFKSTFNLRPYFLADLAVLKCRDRYKRTISDRISALHCSLP